MCNLDPINANRRQVLESQMNQKNEKKKHLKKFISNSSIITTVFSGAY